MDGGLEAELFLGSNQSNLVDPSSYTESLTWVWVKTLAPNDIQKRKTLEGGLSPKVCVHPAPLLDLLHYWIQLCETWIPNHTSWKWASDKAFQGLKGWFPFRLHSIAPLPYTAPPLVSLPEVDVRATWLHWVKTFLLGRLQLWSELVLLGFWDTIGPFC